MQKLKLMIVDDEYLIRQYIRNCIDWERLGYTIVGELGTAQGALQLAEELKPDVVLTDICMPGLDGLSFTGLLKGSCPNVRVIAVTGHDDFEYAQRGIRVGLDNYLLKPIYEKELENVALEIKESILSQQSQDELFRELTDYRRQNEPIVREYYLKKLLEPDFHQDSLSENAVDSLLPGREGFYQTVVVSFDDFSQIILGMNIKKGNTEWMTHYLEKELEDKRIYWVPDKFGHIVFLSREEDFSWETFMAELEGKWKKTFHFPIYYGIGVAERFMKDIYKSYMGANNRLNSAIVFGNNQYQQEKIFSRFEGMANPIPMEDLKKLHAYIETDSPAKVEELVHNWFEKWKHINFMDLFYLKLQLLNAVFYIYSMNTKEEASYDFHEDYKEYYQRIFQIPTLKLLQDCFLDMCRKIMEMYHDEKSVRPSSLIYAVKEYVNMHLSDATLALAGTAEKFYLNSSYLSRIFKKEMGVSFVEYVNAQRIERAKSLLEETDLKIYEVAEKVGTGNANYLGILFKKAVGCTPYEYRSKKRQG